MGLSSGLVSVCIIYIIYHSIAQQPDMTKSSPNSNTPLHPMVENPNDISHLLFDQNDNSNDGDLSYINTISKPYIGPIRVDFVSVQPNTRQRGVVAIRDISAGELLFVTPPTLEASVKNVVAEWNKHQRSKRQPTNKEGNQSGRTFLEECSEKLLLDAMQSALEGNDELGQAKANSFTCLAGSSLSQNSELPSMDRLNAIPKEHREKEDENDNHLSTSQFTRSDLLDIVRHNAFGPDGLHSYFKMENMLLSSTQSTPLRLLALYPLAAMLNHSCVANAVRVFCGPDYNIMAVHALKKIAKGEEIVWNYIPPTQSFPNRQATLQKQYSFSCICMRCQTEEKELYGSEAPQAIKNVMASSLFDSSLSHNQSGKDITEAIRILETQVMTSKSLSNTAKGYLRVAYLQLYTRQLNASGTNVKEKEALLLLAMHLHLSCARAHYASTEHLSILHWCYQTVGQMHSVATDTSKTLPKVRYWTEQLRQVHMVRYGPLGQSLENVRRVMKETRIALQYSDQPPTNSKPVLLL